MSTREGDWSDVTSKTLDNYNERAGPFRAATWDHDVSQNLDALINAIEGKGPFSILDFGCGPGRDLLALKARGHVPVGLDGSLRLAEMARETGAGEVWVQDFLALDLPASHFDGIFANATLQHVPAAALPRVLGELRVSLKPRGVLFASIPRGDDTEGWSNDRYSTYHRPESWQRYCAAAGFTEVLSYFRPTGLPREQQPWFASVWRRA